MPNERSKLRKYFNPLTRTDRRVLEKRLEEYRDQLEPQGYELAIAEGNQGFFAGVLVIDDDAGRFGFLEADGSVTWLTADNQGIGALGTAVLQNHTDELDQEVDGLENAEIE